MRPIRSDSKQTTWAFGACLVMGVLIWILSPLVTGEAEPWDAQSGYYLYGNVGTGVIGGVLGPPRLFWLWPIAICLGQLFGMILKGAHDGDTILGVLMIGTFSLSLFFIQMFIAAGVAAGSKHVIGLLWLRNRGTGVR